MRAVCPLALLVGLLLPAAGGAGEPGVGYPQRLQIAQQDLQYVLDAQQAGADAAAPALEVVELALRLAALSGDYAYYATASDAAAAAAAARNASPRTCLVLARLHLNLHRLEPAREALRGCSEWTDASARALLQADLAFDAGDLAQAEAGYRRLLNDGAASAALIGMANVHEARGHGEEAKALLAEAQRRDHSGDPAQRAWLKLRRGHVALHQGRWDEARALYLAADAALPGWWLIEEHIAEIEALLGQPERACNRYAAIVERTGMPEFMDALAELEQARGQAQAAASLRTRARHAYEARIERFADAASGHALDHYLANDADLPRARDLAERQYRTRRNGAIVAALAQARWRSGDKNDACAAVFAAQEQGWTSAEMLWLAAGCAAYQGSNARAAALRAQALQVNPRAAQMYGLDDDAVPGDAAAELAALDHPAPAPIPPVAPRTGD